MKTFNKKKASISLAIIFSLAASIVTVISVSIFNKEKMSKGSGEYYLNLDSSNAYQGIDQYVLTASKQGEVKFHYEQASSVEDAHVKLDTNGLLINEDQITSIEYLYVDFSGSLQARLSYNKENFSEYFDLVSKQTYQFSSEPYYIELKATSETVITSASYTYSCSKNDASEGEEVPSYDASSVLLINENTLSQGEYNSKKDEYTFSVSQDYKQIYVNVPEKAIVLELNGVSIENDENSPIYVEACDSIDISAKKNTVNYVKDKRPIYTTDVDGQGKGAIYVEDGDLKLKGAGTLTIEANYFNGIHGKDDVEIQKQTLNVTAVNHAIRGNDSITINSGTFNLLCGGDGLHTENSDLSSKGNQRGNITINGGSFTINSWGDALQASYNLIIEELNEETISLDIATNKNSSYDGEIVDTSTSKFYLQLSSNVYSSNYKFAAYINESWYEAKYIGTETTEGGWGRPGPEGRTYYIYEIEKPNSSSSFKLYRFSSTASYSLSEYNAVSDAKAFNDNYDMIQVKSINYGTISFGNWSNYSSSSDVSSKGFKAENEIYVHSGTININAYDDAIHANNDGELENGESPLGNVNILGGTLTLASGDDAIHADGTLNISSGNINITSSYEGLEGNIIEISGGEIYVIASDDGVNAGSGNSTPKITISGGYLDVTVPSNGDTDGIDSNGNYVQSGGVVIVKGPGRASGTNMGSAAIDTDGTVTVSSGTLIIFGGYERTPSLGSGVTKTLCSSSTVSIGSHTVSFSSETYTTALKYSTNGCVAFSILGSASLK